MWSWKDQRGQGGSCNGDELQHLRPVCQGYQELPMVASKADAVILLAAIRTREGGSLAFHFDQAKGSHGTLRVEARHCLSGGRSKPTV